MKNKMYLPYRKRKRIHTIDNQKILFTITNIKTIRKIYENNLLKVTTKQNHSFYSIAQKII